MFEYLPNLTLQHLPIMNDEAITSITTLLAHCDSKGTTSEVIVRALASRTCNHRIAFVMSDTKIVTAVPYILGVRNVAVQLGLTHLDSLHTHDLERIRACIVNNLHIFTGLRVMGFPVKGRDELTIIEEPMPTIWVDSDETLVAWREEVLPWLVKSPYGITSIEELNQDPRHEEILSWVYDQVPDLFLNLKSIPESIVMFNSLLDLCKGRANVRILTAIGEAHPDPVGVGVDKIYNLTELYPIAKSDIHLVPNSKDKAAYMQSGDFLIDDFQRNINEVVSTGKSGCRFERDKVTDVLKTVANYLHEYKQSVNVPNGEMKHV